MMQVVEHPVGLAEAENPDLHQVQPPKKLRLFFLRIHMKFLGICKIQATMNHLVIRMFLITLPKLTEHLWR